jgi:hypothetical protein
MIASRADAGLFEAVWRPLVSLLCLNEADCSRTRVDWGVVVQNSGERGGRHLLSVFW